MTTHTKLDGAIWPSVASGSQRLNWIRQILLEAQIEVSPNYVNCDDAYAAIAKALLEHVSRSDIAEKSLRLLCFRAAIEMEELDHLEEGVD